VLGAESDDQLLVGLLLARLVEHAHVRLPAVESLGSLTETAGETVVHQRQLQDTLEGIQNRHLALGGIGRHLNLLDNLRDGVLFYVRLDGELVSGACSGPRNCGCWGWFDGVGIEAVVPARQEFEGGRWGVSPS
jgi:hypothetical protein